jgi:hypothetical protein
LRTDLGEAVDLVDGRMSEFTVLVDGAPVVTRGLWGLLGVLPPYRQVVAAVRAALGPGAQTRDPEAGT